MIMGIFCIIAVAILLCSLVGSFLLVSTILRLKAGCPEVQLVDLRPIANQINASSRKKQKQGFIYMQFERAGLHITPAMTCLLFLGIWVSFSLIYTAFDMHPIGILAIGVALICVLAGYMNSRISKNKAVFEQQIGYMCLQLASALKSGVSVRQSLEAISQFTEEPLRKQLNLMSIELRHNPDVNCALLNMSKRTGSQDVEYLASIIDTTQRLGGSSADSIARLSETINKRCEMRRLISSESSNGKMAAKAVFGITIFLVFFQFSANPIYLPFYTQSQLGVCVLAVSIILYIVGFIWMYKSCDIKCE